MYITCHVCTVSYLLTYYYTLHVHDAVYYMEKLTNLLVDLF